jgi:7-cyano-7-deazaguanine synthase
VRYGQSHALEVERARELAARLAASHKVIDVDLRAIGGSALTDDRIELPAARDRGRRGTAIPVTYVPARNTVFLALALGYAETLDARDLFYGANAVDYSGYPDCRPEYVLAFERVADLGTRAGDEGRRFRVHAPLLRSSKADIVREALRLGVDLGRTLSCYAPGERGGACGRCEACALRAEGFREAGITDPAGC